MKKGTVIRTYVRRTNPPKVKYIIVFSSDAQKYSFACALINTEINETVNFSAELQALHHPLTKEKNPFLDHKSYADCSYVFWELHDDIMKAVPDKVVGELHPDDLKIVLDIIKKAPTTKPAILKNFKF